jgi:NADH-quinone oxidoreductase subunit G
VSTDIVQKPFWINDVEYDYEVIFNGGREKNLDSFSCEEMSILEYCEDNGIEIPHYCYHKHLSIAGNCRMCLVEMSKSPKPIVSCSLSAHSSFAGSNKIYTNSPLVKKSRENIMEFLLLNHPLDCPICDQGGECDLQDQSLFFGLTRKRFYQQKRFVHNKYLGIIVKTVMSRCIHCTRCIRFAAEIANIKELGVLGRGSKSEIGTYVNNVLNSELSGNLIDICPVGALTSKPYPFLYRDWELKKVKTIDPSDSFGINVLLYLKENSIVKILPSHLPGNHLNSITWISDKTRFIFEGVLSTTSLFRKTDYSWKNVLKQILINVYMLDHMAKHNLLLNSTILLIDENTNIETLSILLLLTKHYPFFKVRRPLKTFFNLDLDFFFKTNLVNDRHQLYKANACLLVGTDIRVESPYLNIQLKRRNKRGNFKTFSIGSKLNLTYPNLNIGSTIKALTYLSEGNTSSGILFKEMKKMISLVNTETCQRCNNTGLFNVFKLLNEKNSNSNWHTFNLINTSLNSLGLSSFQKIKDLSISDLSKTTGIFLIGNSTRSYLLLENYIEQSFLGELSRNKNPGFFVEQTSTNTNQHLSQNVYNNYNKLISNNFFETSASYITADGLQKQVTKFVNSNNNSKEDWQILRKIYSLLSKITFVSIRNTFVSFNLKTLHQIKTFISFMFRTTRTLTDLTFYFDSCSQIYVFKNRVKLKTTHYLTQFKRWIKDFYTGGFEYYSRNSKTMIDCSIVLRGNEMTFSKFLGILIW